MALGAGTYSPFEISFRDKGGEVGTLSLYGIPVEPADETAMITAATAFKSALVAACLGQIIQWSYGGIQTIVNPSGNASSASAQRENKLLLRYHDATSFQKFTVSIPTFDLSLLENNSEFLDLGGTEGAALKSAFEAIVKSPANSSNSVVLDSAQFVGRNT